MKREITNEAQNIGIPVNALMAQILYDWKKALDKERAENKNASQENGRGGEKLVKITIEINSKELAALVLAVQEQQVSIKGIADMIVKKLQKSFEKSVISSNNT